MMKRNMISMVRLNQKEYDFLCKMAERDKETLYKNGKKNLSGYIRKCALRECGYKSDLKKEINELTYQVRKVGVNINQAVKKINSGYYNLDIGVELMNELKEIDQKFSEYLEALGEQNGNNKTVEH